MWLLYAILAALLWGIDYAFAERVLKHISIPTFLTILLFFASLAMGTIAWSQHKWNNDLANLFSSRSTLLLFVLEILAFTSANILICAAIQSKNATVSTLIEISYPFFIALVSWLVFRENQLTLSVAMGGLLIFSGIFVIYYFNH